MSEPQPAGKGKPYDIRERTFEFGLAVIDVTPKLPDTPEAGVVRTQLARAGMSVGANVEEADGAMTNPDRRRIFGIARREAREARFWLRAIDRKWSDRIDAKPLVQESTELIYILSAIIDKL